MLSVKEVSERLGVSPAKVRDFIRSGELPAIDVGSGAYACFRVAEHALDSFMENRRVSAPIRRRRRAQITKFV